MKENLLSVKDISKKLKVTTQYVRQLIRNNSIKALSVGNQWIITEDDLNNYMKEHNIKDYSKETIEKIVKEFSPNIILNRAKSFHMYVAVVSDLIVGVGAIGPYWDSLTEYCILNLYVLPEYENMGYVFKKDGDKLDLEGYYRLEKFPHKN